MSNQLSCRKALNLIPRPGSGPGVAALLCDLGQVTGALPLWEDVSCQESAMSPGERSRPGLWFRSAVKCRQRLAERRARALRAAPAPGLKI